MILVNTGKFYTFVHGQIGGEIIGRQKLILTDRKVLISLLHFLFGKERDKSLKQETEEMQW